MLLFSAARARAIRAGPCGFSLFRFSPLFFHPKAGYNMYGTKRNALHAKAFQAK